MGAYHQFLDVSQAEDLPTFSRRLIAFAESRDFGLVSALVITDHPGQRSEYVTVNNAPDGYKEASVNVESSRRDPVLTRLKNSCLPFVYDQSTYVNAGVGDLWEEQAPFGFKTGIAVALHLPNGKHFMLGFDRPDPLPSQDEGILRLLADLQLVAVHAQEAAVRLLLPPSRSQSIPKLTPRELEVLKWMYAGKTAQEIGMILGLSTHAVTHHKRGIFRKFDVDRKDLALLKALSMKIL